MNGSMDKVIRFSVIMPTYNQCCFIRRAILSLMQQTYPHWELIIVNDGCTDETEEFISDYLADERITYIKNEENQGLGHALNQGLDAAKYEYIAYLPSDDFYFENHLESISNLYQNVLNASLVYTGVQYELPDTLSAHNAISSPGIKPGYCLQLVQTSHRQSIHRWMEREEWVTEDLFLMFWSKLVDTGVFCYTNVISCFWTQHPHQRHKIVSEKYGGGLNKYRSFYHVKSPIKIKVSKVKSINERRMMRFPRKTQQYLL